MPVPLTIGWILLLFFLWATPQAVQSEAGAIMGITLITVTLVWIVSRVWSALTRAQGSY